MSSVTASRARRLLGRPPDLGRTATLVERNILVWRSKLAPLIGGVVEPLLYLAAMGAGLGGLIGDVAGPGGRPVSYAAFLAPALLAVAAMNATMLESFNTYYKLKEQRLYDAALATPVNPVDIATAEIAWALLRAGLYGAGFLAITAALGLIPSPWGIIALPASLLVGFAFGGITVAATTYMRTWHDFDLLQSVLVPLFLFSGTFYPVAVYPPALRAVVQLSPLYHGVELTRALTLGAVGPELLLRALLLAVIGVLGVALAARRIGRLLLR